MHARNNTYVHTNTNQYIMSEHVTVTSRARQQRCSSHPCQPMTLQYIPCPIPHCMSRLPCQIAVTDTQPNLTSTPRESKTHTNKTYKTTGNMQQHSETTDSSITAPGVLTNNTTITLTLPSHTSRSSLPSHRTTGVIAKCRFVIILSVGNNN
jgi:hypothetical protein